MDETSARAAAADFCDVKEGDVVTRMLAGVIEMKLTVTKVDALLIHCGAWTFERETGFEYDPDIGSGSHFGKVASYLIRGDSQ